MALAAILEAEFPAGLAFLDIQAAEFPVTLADQVIVVQELAVIREAGFPVIAAVALADFLVCQATAAARPEWCMTHLHRLHRKPHLPLQLLILQAKLKYS